MTAVITGKAGGKILVMDDEPIIQRMLRRMLTLLGYEVVVTADGASAVDQYIGAFNQGNTFDVVIMDLTIPGGIGGKEAVKKLLEKDPAAKVVVSSGYATDPIMSEYKKYGFSAVVTTPYTINQLQETLRDLLKKKNSPWITVPVINKETRELFYRINRIYLCSRNGRIPAFIPV